MSLFHSQSRKFHAPRLVESVPRRAPAIRRAWSYICVVVLAAVSVQCDTRSVSRPHAATVVVAISTDTRGCEIYDDVLEQFQKSHPDIHIEKVYVFAGDYYQKLLTMIAGNVAPDVMWMGEGFNEFAQRGAFLDLTDRIRQLDTAHFHQGALRWYQLGGRQYGVPYGIDLRFIAINRTLFEKSRIPIPTNGWTFGDFLGIAQRLTVRRDGAVVQWGFCGSLDASSFGAEFVSADGSRAVCDDPRMLHFLATNLDLLNKYQITPFLRDVPPTGVQDSISVFQQGNVAMMPMYTWDLPALRDRCASMDWDIVQNPRVTQRGSWASSQAYVVSSQTQHPDAAWEVVQALTGAQFQMRMSYAMLPADLGVAREVIDQNDSRPHNLKALLDSSDALFPNPRVPNLQELDSLFEEAKQSVWAQCKSPSGAMKEAAQQIDRVIARHARANP